MANLHKFDFNKSFKMEKKFNNRKIELKLFKTNDIFSLN